MISVLIVFKIYSLNNLLLKKKMFLSNFSGVVLNAEIDKGINGCQVKSICSKKAIGRDGRVQVVI